MLLRAIWTGARNTSKTKARVWKGQFPVLRHENKNETSLVLIFWPPALFGLLCLDSVCNSLIIKKSCGVVGIKCSLMLKEMVKMMLHFCQVLKFLSFFPSWTLFCFDWKAGITTETLVRLFFSRMFEVFRVFLSTKLVTYWTIQSLFFSCTISIQNSSPWISGSASGMDRIQLLWLPRSLAQKALSQHWHMHSAHQYTSKV